VTFDVEAEEREASEDLSALLKQRYLAVNSHGAFAREVEPEDLELDMFIATEAEGARFTLCVLNSSSALRFILALLSLGSPTKGIEDFTPLSILDSRMASWSWRSSSSCADREAASARLRCRLVACLFI